MTGDGSRPVRDRSQLPATRPSHPKLAAGLLMVGIVVLLFLISLAPLL